VAAGVRVLGAEGRAEGVDLGQRQAIGLDVELARDRQERLTAEEILRETTSPSCIRGRLARSKAALTTALTDAIELSGDPPEPRHSAVPMTLKCRSRLPLTFSPAVFTLAERLVC
jgi:hypothetical protein